MHGSLVAVFLQLLLCTALSKPQEQLEHRRYSRQHFPVDSPQDPAEQQEPHDLWKRSILDKPNHVPSPLSATNSSLVKRSDGKAAAAAAGETADPEKSAKRNHTATAEDPSNAEMLSHLQKRYVSKSAQNKKKKGMRKKLRGRKKMHRQGNRRNKEHSKRNAEDEKTGDPPPAGRFNDRSSALLMEESSSHLMKRKLLEKKEASKSPEGTKRDNATSKPDSPKPSKRKRKKKPSSTGKNEMEYARLSERYKGHLLNKIVIKADGKKGLQGKRNNATTKEDPGKRDTRHISYASGPLAGMSKKDHLPSIVTKDDKSPSKDKTREKRWKRRKKRRRGRKGRRRRRRRGRRGRKRRRRRRRRGRRGKRRGCRRRGCMKKRKPRNDQLAKNSTAPVKNPKNPANIKNILNQKRIKRDAGDDGEKTNSSAAGQSASSSAYGLSKENFTFDRDRHSLLSRIGLL